MRATILAVLCGIGVLMLENDPVMMQSNIASWLKLLGVSQESVGIENIDLALKILLYGALTISVFFMVKTRNDKKTEAQQVVNIDNSVKSENQSGGITARNVNIGNHQRTLNAETKEAILEFLDKSKLIDITVAMNDQEADIFANEIREFLLKNDYKMEHETMLYKSMSGGRGIPYLGANDNGGFITIGPNVDISDQISFLGMASRPVR